MGEGGKKNRTCDHLSWKKEFMQKGAAQKGECLVTGDRRSGVFSLESCRPAGRFHVRGVMLSHKNSSASSVQKD